MIDSLERTLGMPRWICHHGTPRHPPPHHNQQGQPATILLVDDAQPLRSLVKTILGDYGYTVLEAHNGETCLKIVQEYPDPIHLVVADMFMPGMNGREVATRVLAFRQYMKVLLMSGRSHGNIQSHGGFDPGFGLIVKLFTPETLLRKVSEILRA